MIAYIEGKIIKISDDSVVILTNGGVGYRVYISRSVYREISGIGQEIYLNTYMQVKEDGMALFGFLDDSDLDMFKKLINVSGVGPKMAMSVMSALNTTDLIFAIAGEDAKTIATAPGVGKKLAEKIIVELRDKVSATGGSDISDFAVSGNTTVHSNNAEVLCNEAARALQSLGYSMTEALKAVHACGIEISENTTLEELIKAALRKI